MNVADWSIGYFATDVAMVYSGLNIFEVGIILPFLLRLYRQWILIVSDEFTHSETSSDTNILLLLVDSVVESLLSVFTRFKS